MIYREATFSENLYQIREWFCLIDTTAHEVCQRARCHNCGVKGNKTYRIVYTDNSDLAMDGAGQMRAYGYRLV